MLQRTVEQVNAPAELEQLVDTSETNRKNKRRRTFKAGKAMVPTPCIMEQVGGASAPQVVGNMERLPWARDVLAAFAGYKTWLVSECCDRAAHVKVATAAAPRHPAPRPVPHGASGSC